MKTKLLPCPFCGKDDIGIKDTIIENRKESSIRRVWAYCQYCGAEGRKMTIEAVDGVETDIIAAATETWNRRQSVSGTLEEIRRIICNAYCKQPDIWDDKKEGVELVDSEICGNCVLNLL